MSKNGQLQPSELMAVQGSVLLAKAFGPVWLLSVADAAKDGVHAAIALPDGGYRSLATQRDMHVNPGAHNLNPNSKVPLAPVGQSSHGYGTCVDIVSAAVAWYLKHGAKYGIHRPQPADPNHFSWNGLIPAGLTVTPIPILERNPMSIIAAGRTSDGSIYAQFEPGCPFYAFPSLAEWTSVAAATGASYADWGSDTSVIKKFGTSTDWAKLAPSTVGGKVNVSADMAETNALLTQLIAATKALNPPG